MKGGPYFEVVFDRPVDQTFTYLGDPKAEASVGKRVMAPFGRQDLLGYIIDQKSVLPPGMADVSLKAIRRVVDQEVLFDEREVELARWISRYYLSSLGEALAGMIPSGRKELTGPSLSDEDLDITEKPVELSDEQAQALKAILTEPNPSRMWYLYGITGSGKTEVFLRVAEEVLRQGRTVLYLVPEISLTHQVERAVLSRFGAIATTIHSAISPSARLTEWRKILRAEVRMVVGPRSAVFAPLRNLGLVIIDEEHDGSYKSGNKPRYHARQVALHRVAADGGILLMGSATPSAEAWKLMAEGQIHRLNLTRRLSGGATPVIKPVSLEGTRGCLTKELKEEIRETARLGRQTILFLNRRGFAYFYHCPSCGFELTCKHCSVSLTYHKSRGKAVCHYCGYSVTPPKACPQCGSLEAGFTGFGTEMIEEEVRKTFPDLRIRRSDADTTGKKGSLKETLDVFRAGGIDILLGTQMVAKGLNFPGVRLVGVVLADTGLHLPDFRAAERTFALIVQVSGRAGRYFPDGRVIVQTLRPQDPAILRACELDVEGFYKAELEQRKELGFPPYTRLIRMVLRSKDLEQIETSIRRLAKLVQERLPPEADLLGPAECPIGIIAGNYRRHLILRSPTMGPIHRAAAGALQAYSEIKGSRVYLEVDVDPVQLL
jgi:primosomal protein N' (replication factor Y)